MQVEIEKLEAKNGRLQNENVTLVEILNDYKMENMNLERKMEEEELSSTAVLKEYRRVENELDKLKAEKNLLKNTTERII